MCYRKDVTQRSYENILVTAIDRESAIAFIETNYLDHQWVATYEVES
jgi:hypothetical protein